MDSKKIWRANQRKVGADPEESGGLDPSSWAVRSEKRGGIPIQSKRAALCLQHFGRSNRASSRRLVGSRGGAFSRALQVGQHAIHAWRSAIMLATAPGVKLSATIAAFSAVLQRRRRGASVRTSTRRKLCPSIDKLLGKPASLPCPNEAGSSVRPHLPQYGSSVSLTSEPICARLKTLSSARRPRGEDMAAWTVPRSFPPNF